MKTTMTFRTIANPRRTTLADTDELRAAPEPPQESAHVVLPARTANPRRTVLLTAPKAFVPQPAPQVSGTRSEAAGEADPVAAEAAPQ